MPALLPFTGDDEADRLLAANPLALLLGMLLDQQFPMERAFLSPLLLQRRLGGGLDAAAVAGLPEEDLVAAFSGPPALHRYPASMARRFADLCRHLAAEHGGDAAALWQTAADGDDFYRRLRALPGFGEAKARIFIGVVGRRLGAGPPGWERRAADWPSVADVDDFSKVALLREQKRDRKAGK
ncbi:MAG: Fe-S cluster assembly protein HesB [Actinobacteria bacterium]|nr:Fe-S cluster assembly protein HesB [Actinomycetota bacterium]